MGFFKKLTLDDIAKAMHEMSEEEKDALVQMVNSYKGEDSDAADDVSEATEAAEEAVEEAVEETEEAVDEAEETVEEEAVNGTFEDRLAALEEMYKGILARLDKQAEDTADAAEEAAEATDAVDDATEDAEDEAEDVGGALAGGFSEDTGEGSEAVLAKLKKKYFGI